MYLFKSLLKPATLIALIVLSLLLFIRVLDPFWVQTIRLSTFDYYQTAKPREYSKQPIVIVDIDEESLRQYGQWPWPRTLIADMINAIAKRGGVATGFDIVFSEPDRLSPSNIAKDNSLLPADIRQRLESLPDNEESMAQAMKNHPVVLGQAGVRNFSDIAATQREIGNVGFAQVGEDPIPYLTQKKLHDLIQNQPVLEDAATGYGIFNIKADADNVVRRVPLVVLVRDKIRLALSLELLRVATGGESFAIKTNEAGIEGIAVAGSLINTDGQGNVWPYFSVPNKERYISASSILNGSVEPDLITDKMVLVGTSATGLEDYRAIPLGIQMPGVEIHTQILENILTDQYLKRPSITFLIEFLLALLAGLLVIALVSRLGGVKSSIGVLILIASLFAYSWWNFSSRQFLVDATYPILVTSVLFVFMTTVNYIVEEQQKQRIRSAFGQYLSPALVDQLTDNPDKLVLGGEMRELTILFSDIRGFTTISEHYRDDPAGLTKLMNEVLTQLSKPILEHNGTIDKYLGDAVMAFWNAPIDEKDHAYQACTSALRMIEKIEEMNEYHHEQNVQNENQKLHEINIGIGINTGQCVVGNMGSESRFDYTALGDAVNIASRLEGQSKPYGVPIVIGQSTQELVKDRLAIFEIDLIRVVGKKDALHIYALAGFEALATSEDFIAFKALNASMLSSYRLQDWQSAYDAIGMMESLNEKLKLPLSDYLFIYQTRIEEFRNNPPGQYWDGVYDAASK